MFKKHMLAHAPKNKPGPVPEAVTFSCNPFANRLSRAYRRIMEREDDRLKESAVNYGGTVSRVLR